MLWAPHVGRLEQNTWFTLFGAIVLSLLLLPLSIHWALLPFCLWVLLQAMRVDWALQDRMAIPPLAVLILWTAIGMGVGIPMYVASQEVKLSPPHLTMQLVFLLGSPFLFTGYYLGRGKVSPHWSPQDTEKIFDLESRPLMAVAIFFMLFDILRLMIAWQTESLDRGYAGEVVLDRQVGIWTFASLFGRWNGLWFFFLPLLWRKSGIAMRLMLAICLSFYCIIVVASGSRGLLLFPIIFAVCGLYFFVDQPHFKPERWAPFLIAAFVTYIYIVDVYRNTSQFQESKHTDVSTRLAATSAIAAGMSERADFSYTTGRALVGVADEVVYQLTPDTIPFVGASDIPSAVAWTWVPQLLAPNKPTLWDSNEVAVSYSNNRQERSFSSISLSADLYRRFGWTGVPIGMFLMGLVYGYFVRIVVRIYCNVSVVAGVTLFAFIVGAMQYSGFTSTVLQTWWIWAYDLPKHLIPLAFVVFMIGGGLGKGLGAYSRMLRSSREIP